MTSAVVHDFRERLNYSSSMSDEASWVDFYRQIWPSMLSAVRIDKDSEFQRWGIDRVIFLPNGRQISVDEKKRERNKKTGQLYDDFLLEQYSDLDRKTPGWTLDPKKRCDFIAYAIPELGKCYMLPFEILRVTCTTNLYRWKLGSPRIAINNGWKTQNWAVPWATLFNAMEEEMRRSFGQGVLLDLPVPKMSGDNLVFAWAEPKQLPPPLAE